MTHVLRIAHLKIAHHVCNPEVGKREGNPFVCVRNVKQCNVI